MIRKITLFVAAALLGVFAVALTRTFLIAPARPAGAPAPGYADADKAALAIAERLGEAIRFRTISWGDAPHDAAAYAGFHAFLERAYPLTHQAMTRETVNGLSLLYRWKGAGEAAPVAFIAHSDVVPVEPGTDDAWTHPPFDGVVADGMVWGRGAMDNKGQLIALMEAAESLAASGFRPARDVYFLFGHDEELGGPEGAAKTAALLKARGVRFAMTLDEGSGVVDGLIAGARRPVALVATAEKGSTTLKLTARADGGHSSAPGRETAVSLAARAVVKVTQAPHPLEFDADIVAFLHALAPELPFAQRFALSNLWLTGPLVKRQFADSPTLAAALRTTTAPTMIMGGVKANVLPQEASAIVNYRIHPRDSAAVVKARAERLIDDPRVSVEALGASEPSPRSSHRSAAYVAIAESVAAGFGPIAVAPSLTLQGTDTRNYVGLADDHYRFTPFVYGPDDLKRIHGTDERVAILDLARGAAWYEDFIRRVAG